MTVLHYYCQNFPTVFTPCNHFFLGYLYGALWAFILTEEADTDAVVLNISVVMSPLNPQHWLAVLYT